MRNPCSVSLWNSVFLWSAAWLLATAGQASTAWATSSSSQSLVDQLYISAQDARRSERFDEAIEELHKLLLLDPTHELARRQLNELESFQRATREQAMEASVIDAARAKAVSASSPSPESPDPSTPQWFSISSAAPVRPPRIENVPSVSAPAERPSPASDVGIVEVNPKPSTRVLPPPRSLPASRQEFVRAPDPLVNKVRWWYVFGRAGRPYDGALSDTLEFVIAVPRRAQAPLRIRVLDADIRGREDEQDGMWDTSTSFRVAGKGVREERIVGPEFPDGSVLEFGPYSLERGEPQRDHVFFRVQVEGLEGNDNNLFAFKVSPAEAQVYAYNPAFRLASEAQTWMRFFPMVPAGSSQLVESNFDLDADGGRISLIPVSKDGRRRKGQWIKPSENGRWATTDVAVPPGTDGTRWIYRVIKATQRRGNMAFRVSDDDSQPLPIAMKPISGQQSATSNQHTERP